MLVCKIYIYIYIYIYINTVFCMSLQCANFYFVNVEVLNS